MESARYLFTSCVSKNERISAANEKLSNNLLKIIRSNTFDGLFSLEHLKLDGNPVTLIETAGFHGLRKLRELNLTNLDLETIHDNAFSGMDTLQRLYLDRNANLYRLPLDIFENLPLEFLKADRFEFCCIAKLSGANCSAPKDLFSSCNDLMANETLGISIWILGCIALFGNGFVLIWRLKTKSESRVHSLLLLNLALSDFMMGVYMVVIGSVDKYYRGKYFIYNEEWKRSHLCQFCGFLSTVSCEASVFILTTMTVDRYVAIVHPLRNLCLKISGAYKALISIWLLAFILAFLPLTGIKYFKDFYGRSGVCLPLHLTAEKPAGWEYSVFVFLVLNFISFMAIFILYFIMFIKIKQSHQLTGTGSHQRSATASIGSRMVFIVLTDFVCWIPIIIIGIASLSGMQAPPEVYAWVAVFVLPLNSALNPILYTISTTNFRKNVGAHYRRSSKRLQNLTYFTTDNPETEISRRVTKSMSLSTTKTTTPDTTLERRTLLRRNGKPASQKKTCKSCCSPIAERQEFIESPV
ncbi:predicted protein [Nematostella vectensis]|uniref:G-protein coupled receptors family 1 profile domain-containing protein n=1 Tax=Nematostella vectensis TaxID=45351 RepID=A7SU96_NEMVE|nr:predicted protein [Nematostella vectensis]|eukprot:XP_001624838.1 predicted protein [Nematostella vectensis]